MDAPAMTQATPLAAVDVVAPKRDETIIGLLERAAATHPGKPYVIFPDLGGASLSYAATLVGATRVARALRAAGIGPGARIAVYLPNGPAYVLAWMGTLMAGMADVTINPGARGASLAYALTKARVDAVITDRDGLVGLATVTGIATPPPLFLVPDSVEPTAVLSLGWGDWSGVGVAAKGSDAPFPASDPLKFASIRYTSGSTGMPKGVMQSQAHMLASAKMFCFITGFCADDVMYTCFPVHHVFASVTGILATLTQGGTLVLARKFSASQYWSHLIEYGVTVSHALDAPIAILLANPPSAQDRAHRCRVLYTASQAFPQFEERFGIKILPLFDMSELTVVAYYPHGVEKRAGSCGVSSGLFDIAIVDDQDYAVPTGEEGQIVVRPRVPHIVMMGYFDDGELTVERWSNLWFHTGDRGVMDTEGYLYFKGRMGDRIRRRGVNISAAEIEAAALRHPDIAEVAVIGVPAAFGEDDIKVCASLKSGCVLEPAALRTHLKGELAAHQMPRYIEIRAQFPRTDTEKIRKAALRDEGASGLTSTTWDADTGTFWTKGR